MRLGVLVMVVSGCSFQLGTSIPFDGAPIDGDAAVIDSPFDAAIDAAIDADPSVCSTEGLVCPSGTTPRLIPCAPPGGCWVGCRDGASIDHAAAVNVCATWGGKLGWIDSAAEETCLRLTIDGAIMLGLEQAAGSVAPILGWTWNGDTAAPAYINWSVGQPNDGDGVENGTEQCAYSASSTTWQDEPCTSTHSRFTCRR